MAPRRARTDRGAAAVEFALVLVPLLYLVFGTISYAYMFSFRQALSQAASEGARASVSAYSFGATTCAAGVTPTLAACPAQFAAANAVAGALSTYNMTCASPYLTCTVLVGDSSTIPLCASGHQCASVTVTYPYRSHSLLPTVPGFGIVLPSTLTFTSTVQIS